MTKRRDVNQYITEGGDLTAAMERAAPIPPAGEDGGPVSDPPGATAARRDAVYVDGLSTWETTRQGPVRLAPYILRFTRDIHTPRGRVVEGQVLQDGAPPLSFTIDAVTLGDPRGLRKELARLLGARFRNPRGRLDRILNAWLDASRPEEVVVGSDFGFSADGLRFVDRATTLPEGNVRFAPPAESAAAGLGLALGDGAQVIRELLDVWPALLHCRTTAAALLGVAGWGLVAPVLEARDPGVAPLLAFLHGASGFGKSKNAGVVQCFFGDFSVSLAAVSFGSTPLSIEQEAFHFRGAVMVVGDVKVGTIAEGGVSKVLGLVQRAGDRAERRRLDNTGRAVQSHPSRATWLFDGEDVPVTEGSALARLLILRIPQAPRQMALLGRLEALMPRLPSATRALVDHLLTSQPWPALLASYRARSAAIAASIVGSPNAVRLAKSIAAVAVGLEVWTSWLDGLGVAPPAHADEVATTLCDAAVGQLYEVVEAGRGERFLGLFRELLASASAHIGEAGDGGDLVGIWSQDHAVAYVLPSVVLGRMRKTFPDATSSLADARCILDDLWRMGAIAEHDRDRHTKKVRIGRNPVSVWAIHARFLRD
jgi:hypothetical protein